MRGERRNREEWGRKLLPFTINLHNFTFSLAAYGSERKTTCSRSSGVRLACEISAITPQKKKRPCRLLSQMLRILFFLITADPQLTDTLSLYVYFVELFSESRYSWFPSRSTKIHDSQVSKTKIHDSHIFCNYGSWFMIPLPSPTLVRDHLGNSKKL